jgi:Ca2+-dependent lipid-binding protein
VWNNHTSLQRAMWGNVAAGAKAGTEWEVMLKAAEETEEWRHKSLRLVLAKADGLIAADFFGKSDPFVTVTSEGKRVFRSKVR